MSGLHLVKRGREQKKVDLHRDFTVASPAEFVTRFGGDRVIEKVQMGSWHSGCGRAEWENQLQTGCSCCREGARATPLQILAKCWVLGVKSFSPS